MADWSGEEVEPIVADYFDMFRSNFWALRLTAQTTTLAHPAK